MVAVVDASRARLLAYERSVDPAGLDEKIVEHRDFINPARRLTPAEQLAESPGSSRTSGGAHFGYDDHRDARTDAQDVEFARMVNRELATLLQTVPAKRLIVCASPRMLGHLRDERGELLRALDIEELARDLVKLSPTELRDHLVLRGLLPAK